MVGTYGQVTNIKIVQQRILDQMISIITFHEFYSDLTLRHCQSRPIGDGGRVNTETDKC